MKKILFVLTLTICFLNAEILRSSHGYTVDTKTKLWWSDKEVKEAIWEDAVNYCEDLEIGGFKGWRLPTSNELYSLVDVTKANPAIQDGFENIVFGYFNQYWTSTVDKKGLAVTINFALGETDYSSIIGTNNENINVICVQ